MPSQPLDTVTMVMREEIVPNAAYILTGLLAADDTRDVIVYRKARVVADDGATMRLRFSITLSTRRSAMSLDTLDELVVPRLLIELRQAMRVAFGLGITVECLAASVRLIVGRAGGCHMLKRRRRFARHGPHR